MLGTGRWGVLLALGAAAVGCGSGDPGLIDCAAYIDRHIACGIIPPENADAVRDTNIAICNRWEETYKEGVMTALAECIDVPCPELQVCIQQANQLCQADVGDSVDSLCEQVVECQWEQITTMPQCQEELGRNQGLYMCLKPEVLADYVACVRDISCGPDSEDAWYACGFEHVQ